MDRRSACRSVPSMVRQPTPRIRPPHAHGGCSFALLAAAVLAGCTVGPDFQPPLAPNVSGYTPQPVGPRAASARATGGEAQRFVRDLDLPGQWWMLFHCEALNTLIEKALATNPDLQAAQAALRAAKQNLYAQQGTLFPALDANFAAA